MLRALVPAGLPQMRESGEAPYVELLTTIDVALETTVPPLADSHFELSEPWLDDFLRHDEAIGEALSFYCTSNGDVMPNIVDTKTLHAALAELLLSDDVPFGQQRTYIEALHEAFAGPQHMRADEYEYRLHLSAMPNPMLDRALDDFAAA